MSTQNTVTRPAHFYAWALFDGDESAPLFLGFGDDLPDLMSRCSVGALFTRGPEAHATARSECQRARIS